MSPQADSFPDKLNELDGWEYHFAELITGGEDISVRSELIKENGVIDAENLFFLKGRIVKDTGYVSFGAVVRGTPRFAYQFFLTDGSSALTLLTNTTFYKWNASTLEWQYVSGGNATTLSVAASATDTSITVVDASGFADGDYIGILLDDGTEDKTTVNGAPAGNVITLTDAITGAAAISNAVVEPLLLSGDNDVPTSVVTWAAKDRMYFTNGVDTPQYYDGTECQDIPSLPGSTFTCRLISIFNDFIQLLFTTEDGTAHPQRIRWSNAGFDDQWNALVNFNDFHQTEDWITAVEPIGPYNIIYRERGIIRQSFLGEADKTWDFIPTISGEGAVSADAVVSLGDSHIVFGNSNIYEYFGEFDLTPIGDEIYDRVFGINGDLNPAAIGNVFSVYVEELDEVWMFYPQNADTAPKIALRYKVSTKAWSHRTWPVSVVGFGFYQTPAALTWENAQGTWADQTSAWVTKVFLDASPTTLLCDADSVRVNEYDYVQTQDNGSDISYVLETKDYYHPVRDLRFDRFDFMILGSNVLIEYSNDKGVTWTTLGTKSPGAIHAKAAIWKQFVAPRIRFRLSGTSTFGLEWLGFRFKLESFRY